MVTIHDLTWDDDRLLELFILLDRRDQGQVMKMASVAACHAAAKRSGPPKGDPAAASPDEVTLAALGRCRPPLPSGWASDSDFEFEVANNVLLKLGDRALDMILTTADHDDAHARVLAGWAEAHALRIGSDFCAPTFEDGYVSVEAMRAFIEEWRDGFMSNLRRAHAANNPEDRKPNA